jgi:hypothetical protein
MEKQTLTFTMERTTKNTIRYQEDADGKPPAIGTLYVQKWLLGKEPPKRLTVTIGEVEE